MIVVKLKGGLGNQMFQYSMGKKLSLERKETVKFDNTFLERPSWQELIGATVWRYGLGEFNTKAPFAGFWEKIHPTKVKEILFNVKDNLKKIGKIKGSVYLDGFWQSEEYFNDIKSIICRDFRLKSKSKNFIKMAKLISGPGSVSLHFRRGDYAKRRKTKKYHGLLTPDYYHKAVNLICQSVKNPRFFVFSDDVSWVKVNFKIRQPVTYISGFCKLTNAEELVLMSLCKHNIIANSSFSWWGAWLNSNPSKIVVAPGRWFRAKIKHESLLPGDWVKI
jgi:hypothetical protein